MQPDERRFAQDPPACRLCSLRAYLEWSHHCCVSSPASVVCAKWGSLGLGMNPSGGVDAFAFSISELTTAKRLIDKHFGRDHLKPVTPLITGSLMPISC